MTKWLFVEQLELIKRNHFGLVEEQILFSTNSIKHFFVALERKGSLKMCHSKSLLLKLRVFNVYIYSIFLFAFNLVHFKVNK